MTASEKKLGIWMATSLVVGNMIGSGVFLLPASLAGYGGISLLGWGFTTTGAVLLALVYAKMSGLMPKAGGHYAYTRDTFGDFPGFLVAWGYWISIWVANAAIAVAFVGYLSALVPPLEGAPRAQLATGIAAIWLLTWVNARGVRGAGFVQVATTALKLLPLIAIATLGLIYFDPVNLQPFNATGQPAFNAITAAATLTLFSFLGLESAAVPATEVANPTVTIPRATLIGTLVTAAVYVLGTTAVMGVMPADALATSEAPFADAAATMWGTWARPVVAVGAVVSCFGALNGWILLSGQVPLAVATDRLFPARFQRVSSKGAPVFGLAVSSVLASVLMTLNYTRGLVGMYTFMILLATLTGLIPYLFTAGAELMLLVREPERFDARRLRGYAVIASLALVYSFWAIYGAGQETVFYGFLLLMTGVPIYVWIHWARSKSSP